MLSLTRRLSGGVLSAAHWREHRRAAAPPAEAQVRGIQPLCATRERAHVTSLALTWLSRATPVFTNILKESFLQELADADEGELIKQVQASTRDARARCVAARPLTSAPTRAQEFYADYWALDTALVSLELEASNVACFQPQTWESQARLRYTRACVRAARAGC